MFDTPIAAPPDPFGDRAAGRTADRVAEIAGVAGAWCPSLSPDGEQVAYVTDRSGLPRLEVLNLATDVNPVHRQVSLPDEEVVSVAWSPDGQWLAYLVSPNGLIRAELHVVRPDGSGARTLAGTDALSTVFAGCWTTLPSTYAFSLANGQGPGADVCLVDVVTGQVRTVASGGFLAVTSVSPDASRIIARRGSRGRRHLVIVDVGDGTDGTDSTDGTGSGTGTARRVLAGDFPDEGTDLAEEGRFSADGSAVYLRTNAGRERTVLAVVALGTDGTPGPYRVLAERADADLESYAVLSGGHSAFLVWNVEGSSVPEIRNLVTGTSYRFDLGAQVMPGWSVRPNGRSAVVELTSPTRPRSLYRLDWDGPDPDPDPGPAAPRSATSHSGPHPLVGMPAADLPRLSMAEPEQVRYPSLDGLSVAAWLYRPDGASGPMPTVVVLHGGPESQERPAFSILIQSLVAAGFAVMAPNVRGSTGYGRTFTAMDDLGARESSFQDVPATVDFLVEAGLAVPGQIGVHGWSYGGYLAMIALTRWPELFACGSSHAGMSDFAAFFAETESWMAAASVTEYGDPRADAEMLYDLSPLNRMHEVLAPTLLVHGEQDTNVPVIESVRAHDALSVAGVPTELLLLPGEGHSIVGRAARIELSKAVTGWHERWIG
ncbi:MAG TPA: S9 family peptidase [Nakamurella sp.]|nr:S9 family peptidase [Nakamurella sp.]